MDIQLPVVPTATDAIDSVGLSETSAQSRDAASRAVVGRYGLTEQQGLYVREYVNNGFNQREAAVAAGFSETSAHSLHQNPRIQAAIQGWMESHLMSHAAPKSLGFLVKALDDQRMSGAARVRAAECILEMAGYKGRKGDRVATPTDKPMDQWTIEELNAFIGAGSASLQQLHATRERTIEHDARDDARNGDARP